MIKNCKIDTILLENHYNKTEIFYTKTQNVFMLYQMVNTALSYRFQFQRYAFFQRTANVKFLKKVQNNGCLQPDINKNKVQRAFNVLSPKITKFSYQKSVSVTVKYLMKQHTLHKTVSSFYFRISTKFFQQTSNFSKNVKISRTRLHRSHVRLT